MSDHGNLHPHPGEIVSPDNLKSFNIQTEITFNHEPDKQTVPKLEDKNDEKKEEK